MTELLKAGFYRMRKDKPVWLLSLLMFLIGAMLPLAHYFDSLHSGIQWSLDLSFFIFAFLAPIALSVFTSLYIGSEYGNGTLRNKIIAGHRRSSIYLSNLLISISAGAFMCLAYMLPHLVLGLLLNGRLSSTPKTIAIYIGLSFALVTAVASILVLISMLCRNKAHTTVGCILTVFVLLFVGIYLTSALNEPEYLPAYTYIENGVTVEEPATKNPNYVGGKKREVYEFLQDFTSGGQMLQIADMDVEKPSSLSVYNGITVLVTTIGGIIFFRRKDLK